MRSGNKPTFTFSLESQGYGHVPTIHYTRYTLHYRETQVRLEIFSQYPHTVSSRNYIPKSQIAGGVTLSFVQKIIAQNHI